MVVDDEEFNISSMKAILFKIGANVEYQCDFCITGQEAVDQVKIVNTMGFKYSIILTDIQMPIKDGITATKEIREYFDSIELKREDQPKIIGVTGHVLEDFYRQGNEAGMDEIVAKPLYI